jgi:FtsH-binding integral membrane protein
MCKALMLKEALPENKQQEPDQQDRFQFFNDSYGLVLISIIIAIIITAALPETRWDFVLNVVILGMTLQLAQWASHEQPKTILTGTLALVISTIITIIYAYIGIDRFIWIPALICTLLIAVTPIDIVRRLLTHKVVNTRTVLGALCIFLLFGLFFAYLCATLGPLIHIPIFVQVKTPSLSDDLYFSYMTLTTVGYGDLTPGCGLMRALAVVEALGGQLYLVTVIALLVGNFGMSRNRQGTDQ